MSPRRQLTPRALLLLVTAVYALVQLLVVRLTQPLGWDEAIYVSQFGKLAPAAWFDAPRSRGVTLLAAPVVSVTSDVRVLRAWLVVVSAAALYAGFRTWTGVRGDWVVPAAAAAFAGLWVTEYYGAEVMPNLYVALAALGAAGFAVRALRRPGWWPLLGLTLNVAWAALVRPSDAFWFAVGLVLSVVTVSLRRDRRRAGALVAATTVLGAAAGVAEWVVEAYTRFGGLGPRLHAAAGEQASRLTFSLWTYARAVNGPILCRPCGASHHLPVAGALWWLLIPPLVAVALVAAWREKRLAEALVPTTAAVTAAVGYFLFIPYAAPRFLLPSYALLAPPAIAGAGVAIRWFRDRVPHGVPRAAGYAVAALFALLFLAEQGLALRHADASRDHGARAEQAAVRYLKSRHVQAPCVIGGHAPYEITYWAGCRYDSDAVADIEQYPHPDAPKERNGDDTADVQTAAAAGGRVQQSYALVLPRGVRAPAVVRRTWHEHVIDRGRLRIFVPPDEPRR